MQNVLIRVKEAELINFKNVEYGKLDFPGETSLGNKINHSEIVGIYGQNGSGKTAFVDAMSLIQYLLSGKELPKNTGDYICVDKDTSTIKLVLSVNGLDHEYLIFYEVELERIEESKAKVIRESLSYKVYDDNEWKNKAGIIFFTFNNKEDTFKPQKNYRLLTSNNPENKIDLGVAKKLSEKNGTSFIFSSELEEIIRKSESFSKYTKLILALKHYADVNLFII
jgi:AAA15 family ATPase/GTPase